MKSKLLQLLFILQLGVFTQAQVPNAGFENWTGTEPDEWLSNNILDMDPYVIQTTDSESGSYAIKLEIGLFNGFPFGGSVSAGNGQGFPVSQRYPALNGYIKFMPTVSTTQFLIYLDLLNGSNPVGIGTLVLSNTSASFTQFSIPINYLNEEIPDIAYVSLAIVETNGTPSAEGSYAIVDELSFGAITSVVEEDFLPSKLQLEQNYPNPFNPSTRISWQAPSHGYTTLKVFDALGNEVRTLVNENTAAGTNTVQFDAGELSSGIYLYQIRFKPSDGIETEVVQTRKMLLIK